MGNIKLSVIEFAAAGAAAKEVPEAAAAPLVFVDRDAAVSAAEFGVAKLSPLNNGRPFLLR